jgi:hypothetical protein
MLYPPTLIDYARLTAASKRGEHRSRRRAAPGRAIKRRLVPTTEKARDIARDRRDAIS